MADPVLGGISVPADQKDRGTYIPIPLVQDRRNGLGVLVGSRFMSAEWHFPTMTVDQWNWWVTTLLAGERSKLLIGTTVLWTDANMNTSVTFGSCVVDRPVFEAFRGNLYQNVIVKINGLSEA